MADVAGEGSERPAVFATTRLSVVRRAGAARDSAAAQALQQLCQTYWPPVYGYIRRQGKSPTDAEDLTQAFFVHLLDSNFLGQADEDRGRFRSYLLKSVTNFLNSDRRRQAAEKRGGNRHHFSLDADREERTYLSDPATAATPEIAFERRWALTIIDETTAALRREYSSREQMFELLYPHMNQQPDRVPYDELTETLQMSPESLRQNVRRMKLGYREILRAEIAATVECSEDVDDELTHLLSVPASPQ